MRDMPYLFDEKANSIPINDAVSRRWDKKTTNER
jgi:hypothetical protein